MASASSDGGICPPTVSGPSSDSVRPSYTPVPGVTRTRSTRRKPWRKLLWVKQNYPDNWVDSSFLNQLQRNVNVHPYDFWALVAESTVITQQLSTVVIFVMCFIAIFTERISPVLVVGGSSTLTVLAYWVWDLGWEVREAEMTRRGRSEQAKLNGTSTVNTPSHSPTRGGNKSRQPTPLSINRACTPLQSSSPNSPSAASFPGSATPTSELHTPIPRHQHALYLEQSLKRESSNASFRHAASPTKQQNGKAKQSKAKGGPGAVNGLDSNRRSKHNSNKSSSGKGKGGRHTRNSSATSEGQYTDYKMQQQGLRRLRTAKSAMLIYCTILGLSPILRSLTESISSDSIWAISTWLFLANCLSFDYGSGVTVKFPASLSTNAAIMSSVVLASRLPTTTHVFSLVLFSIEMFGLFPVFRRYLRHISWNGHVALTVLLVCGAACGLGLNVGWGWAWGWIGLMGPGIMGGCSWWLMWLQRYKNEIHGPWDPAKPVIRTQWES